VCGNMNLYAGAVWLRLHFDMSSALQKKTSKSRRSSPYNPNNSVFIVTFDHSPFVIISSSLVRLSKIVMQGLKISFGVKGLRDIKLSGRHVASLADIVHRRNNEAVSSVFRDKERKESHLYLEAEVENVDKDLFENEDFEKVIDEKQRFKKRRQTTVEQAFGCAEQPYLETLDYEFSTRFGGRPVFDMPNQTKVLVEIKGPSVLSGMKQLCQRGYVKLPFRRHLNITQAARNSFSIADKKVC